MGISQRIVWLNEDRKDILAKGTPWAKGIDEIYSENNVLGIAGDLGLEAAPHPKKSAVSCYI